MRSTPLVLLALFLTGCSGATPTPIVIYVTPSPGTATTSPSTAPTAAPTLILPTAAPTLPVTAKPATPTAAQRQDPQIVDYGFQVNDGTANYAVIIRNPNPSTYAAVSFSVQITLSNDGGPVVTETEYMSLSLPGIDNAVVGYSFDVEGNPDRMEVRLGPIDWDEIDFTPGRFEFGDVRTKEDDFGGYTTKGTATSQFQLQQENAELVAVYRNAAGEIVGGDSTYIDFIDPGQTISFEINTLSDVKNVDSTEMYWAW